MRGSAANFVPRGKHSDCVLRTKQGAVFGCVAEPLPAAETGEAEQGQRRRPRPVDEAGSRRWRSGLNMQASSLTSKYASGRRPALHIWSTATRSSAPVFASTHCGAPQKSAKRKRQTQRLRPADETGSCVWRRAPIFTRGHRPPQGKLAKRKRNAVCLLQGRCDARCKSREPQSKEFLSRGCAQKWVPPKAFRFWTAKGGVRRA